MAKLLSLTTQSEILLFSSFKKTLRKIRSKTNPKKRKLSKLVFFHLHSRKNYENKEKKKKKQEGNKFLTLDPHFSLSCSMPCFVYVSQHNQHVCTRGTVYTLGG